MQVAQLLGPRRNMCSMQSGNLAQSADCMVAVQSADCMPCSLQTARPPFQ